VLVDGWERAEPTEREGTAAFAFARTPWWERADPDGRRALESAAQRLADGGARVREVDLPERFAGLPDAHDTVMAFDVARSLAWEHEHHADRLSDVLRAFIERGAAIARADAERALALGATCRADFETVVLRDGEALLVPAVVGEPPPLQEGNTGDPWFCRPWTLLGAPALAIPAATGSGGAPIGVQLVAPPGADGALLRVGAWAVRHLN
jgi:Asp-tRNA(Asn)/Glu-tRNA(Gln) amidotransferase A subunit family amidase